MAIDMNVATCIIVSVLSITCVRRFLQNVSIACYAEPCISYDRDVCLSVCLFVTCWYCVKKRKLGSQNLHRRIVQGL